MPEEKKQKDDKKENFNIDKARKIVLESIGENELAGKEKDSQKINNGIIITKEPVNIPDLPLKSFRENRKTIKVPAKQGVSAGLKKKITPAKPPIVKLIKEKKTPPKEDVAAKIKKENKPEQSKEIFAAKITPIKNKKQYKLTRLAFISLFSAVLFFAFYCAFTILIIRFNVDNKITRTIADYLPVPAYFSSDKIIEYYKFKDIIKKSGAGNEEKIKSEFVALIFGNNPEKKVWSLVD
jgi:hypothetical protein